MMDTKTQLIAKRGDRVTLTTWGFVAFHVIGAKNKAQLQEALHDFATTSLLHRYGACVRPDGDDLPRPDNLEVRR